MPSQINPKSPQNNRLNPRMHAARLGAVHSSNSNPWRLEVRAAHAHISTLKHEGGERFKPIFLESSPRNQGIPTMFRSAVFPPAWAGGSCSRKLPPLVVQSQVLARAITRTTRMRPLTVTALLALAAIFVTILKTGIGIHPEWHRLWRWCHSLAGYFCITTVSGR